MNIKNMYYNVIGKTYHYQHFANYRWILYIIAIKLKKWIWGEAVAYFPPRGLRVAP